MNATLLLGVGLDALFAVAIMLLGEHPGLGVAMLVCAGASVLGAVLIAAEQRRFGAYLVLGSSIIFIPLGIVAALGARKVLDELSKQEFETRRGSRA
jgi:hypothetical protein